MCEKCPVGTHAEAIGSPKCAQCGSNSYSAIGFATCIKCPKTNKNEDSAIESCEGKLTLKDGFWRPNQGQPVQANTSFYRCPLSDACLVNRSTNKFVCAKGYKPSSPLCAVCEFGYAVSSSNKCKLCQSVEINTIAFVLGTVTTLGYIVLAVKSSRRKRSKFAAIQRIFI